MRQEQIEMASPGRNIEPGCTGKELQQQDRCQRTRRPRRIDEYHHDRRHRDDGERPEHQERHRRNDEEEMCEIDQATHWSTTPAGFWISGALVDCTQDAGAAESISTVVTAR